MRPISEYVQEDGPRSAHIFRNPASPMVVVMLMEEEQIVEDHFCSDLEAAEELADQWVSTGKIDDGTKEAE